MYRHVVFRCKNRRAGLRRINLGSAVGFSGQECKSPATPQILRTNDWQINGAQFLFTPVGAFRQHNSGDCFFLVSVFALINDADGRLLVENSLAETPEAGTVKVIFPNQPDLPIIVSQADLTEHKLYNAGGRQRSARLVSGDPDMQMIEVAADRLWTRQNVKEADQNRTVGRRGISCNCSSS